MSKLIANLKDAILAHERRIVEEIEVQEQNVQDMRDGLATHVIEVHDDIAALELHIAALKEDETLTDATIAHLRRNSDATPAAACGRCGGWHSRGGMSQYSDSVEPVIGRVGCNCHPSRN